MPVLSLLDDKWCTYSEQFIERMAGGSDPWFLYHCTRGAHFDNYPHPDFLGASPAKHPYKDAIVELDAICGRLVAALERTGQLETTMVRHLLGQRPGDGDLARLGLHARSAAPRARPGRAACASRPWCRGPA